MGVFDKWKKEMENKLKKYTKEEELKQKIPAIIKRCPKCAHLTLQYDPETGRIHCTNCGFEEHIPMTKEG